MPAKPRWHAHLDAIRRTLNAMQAPFLDRPTVERLFSVGPRQANYLMRSLDGYRIGSASVVSREQLLAKLDALAGERGYLAQAQRKARVIEALDELRRDARPRPVSVPPARRSGSALPEGVRLSAPGELTISFSTPEDLLGCVMGLAQSAAEDYAAFVAGLDPVEGSASARPDGIAAPVPDVVMEG